MKILMESFEHHCRGTDYEIRVYEAGDPICVLYYVEAWRNGARIAEPHVLRAFDGVDMKSNTHDTVNGIVQKLRAEINNGTIGS
jgi:hypothetical protein